MTTTDDANPVDGAIAEPGFMQEAPEDIDNFLVEHGIKDVSYVCTIKRYPKEGAEISEFLPGSTKNGYPSVEDLGRRFGPGKYLYCFAWKETDEHGKRKNRMKEYKIILGSEWDDIYDEYMAEMYVKKQKRLEATRQRAKLVKAMRGEESDGTQREYDPIEGLKESMGLLKELGVPIGGSGNGKSLMGTDSENLGVLGLLLNMSQKSAELQMKMMMQMNQQSTALITALISNQQPNSNEKMFTEIMNMVTQTVQLREALNPEKKGVVDRVFELMESVLPQIMQMAQMPRQQRLQHPLYKVAMNSDEMNQMKNDPEMLKEWIKQWDAAHGPDQTDVILQTIGITRPGQPAPQPQPETAMPEEPEEVEIVEPELVEPDENPLTGESASGEQ